MIDSQYASSTKYVDVVDDYEMLFGVNFADGRIKGYGMQLHGQDKTYFVLYVRGSTEYGQNAFIDNGDGTITDEATGLMWAQEDSGDSMNWESALSYCEDLTTAGYDDWRLPDVKELQSIVDYTRSPGTTDSAAIDTLFSTTEIVNEVGESDYGFYWSGTTHMSSNGNAGWGSYVSLGEPWDIWTTFGWMCTARAHSAATPRLAMRMSIIPAMARRVMLFGSRILCAVCAAEM